MANEVEIIEIKPEARISDLSVNVTDRSMQALSEQRGLLKEFVTSQLREGLDGDFAQIPGTNKKTLLQPGAEKLGNIFQLGSRIVDVQREIDPKNRFAMFTYTVEVYHIPSGKAIAQCQGSANTMEKKQANKDFGFLINSLGKMAQKRAFVGAIIRATGASDFFTQDMEDAEVEGSSNTQQGRKTAQASMPKVKSAKSHDDSQKPICCGKPMMASKFHENTWYCVTCKTTKPMGE